MRFLYQQGPRHLSPLQKQCVLPLLFGSSTFSFVIALDLGLKSIRLPSTSLGAFHPSVSITPNPFETRASARLDSDGSMPDLSLALLF